MSALAMPEAARRRYARFFRGTMREPHLTADDHNHRSMARTERSPNSAVEIEALHVIRSNLQAKALSHGGQKLTDAHRTLLNFETWFNTSVWFACFPPGERNTCHLFLNRSLAGLQATTIKGNRVLPMPLRLTRLADERRDFMAVVVGAISLR